MSTDVNDIKYYSFLYTINFERIEFHKKCSKYKSERSLHHLFALRFNNSSFGL